MVLMANSSFLMQVRRERTVLGLEEAETENFLHNLVTVDILGLAQGAARYAALLTPQGKILFDFFVVKRRKDICWTARLPNLKSLRSA